MNRLENLLIESTYEFSSQIGFYKHNIQKLVKYIEFRERYNKYTDEELLEIIDGNLSLKLKRDLSKRFLSKTEMFTQIAILRTDWNKVFNCLKYFDVKKQLQI